MRYVMDTHLDVTHSAVVHAVNLTGFIISAGSYMSWISPALSFLLSIFGLVWYTWLFYTTFFKKKDPEDCPYRNKDCD